MGGTIVTQGNEQLAAMKEVWYSGTDELKTGYALCYNYDSVTDYMQKTSTQGNFSRTATAFAEGSQDFNARFLEVEKPSGANLHCFAGVVDAESAGVTGPAMIKINVPVNGVVPVYTDLSTTNSRTVFAVQSASYALTTPVYGGSTTSFRVVGVAAETIDRSSTNGLCWARLGSAFAGPYEGDGVSTNLVVGAGTSSGDVIFKMISVETAQTGGTFSALRLRGEIAGAGSGAELGAAARIEGVVNSTLIDTTCASSIHLVFKTLATNKDAGTLYEALYCKVENQDSTPAVLTDATVQVLRLVTELDEDPGEHSMIRFEAEGSDKPDYLFTAKDLNAIAGTVSTGDAPAPATGDLMCKVQVDTGTGAGDWYIVLLADSGA